MTSRLAKGYCDALMPGSNEQKTIRLAYGRLQLTFNVLYIKRQKLRQKITIRKQNESQTIRFAYGWLLFLQISIGTAH